MSDFQPIGCKRCGRGENWNIQTNGNGEFIARCNHCGHCVFINQDNISHAPDLKAIDLRFFT